MQQLQSQFAGAAQVSQDGSYEINGLEAGEYTILAARYDPNKPETPAFASVQVVLENGRDVELDLAVP